MACLIASRKVTCVPPFAAVPEAILSGPPFSQRQLASLRVLRTSSPGPLLHCSRQRLLPSARASPCPQNESARFHRPNLCRYRILPRSRQRARSILEESLPKPAAPTSRESYGSHRRCNKRRARRIRPAGKEGFPPNPPPFPPP